MSENGIAKLIIDLKESLEREMAGIRQEIAGVNKRLDHMAGTYERHSNLIGADVLNVRGMEHSVMAHDKAIENLTRRVEDLERGK